MTKNKIPKSFPTVSLKGPPSQAFLDIYKTTDFSKHTTINLAGKNSAPLSPIVARSLQQMKPIAEEEVQPHSSAERVGPTLSPKTKNVINRAYEQPS